MQTTSSAKGLLLVAGATLFWSLSGVFVRWLPGVQPWTFNAYRGLGMALAILAWTLWHYRGETIAMFRRSEPTALLISAGAFALGSSLYIVAMNLSSVAAVSCLGATSGLFAGVLARIWLGEKTQPVFYVAVFMALGGATVIALGEGEASINGYWGTLIGLGVAFCFALQSVSLRRYKALDMEPAMLLGGLGVFALVAASGLLVALPLQSVALLLLMGAVQLALPLVLYMRGARSVGAVQMVVITMADAILNPLWVWLVHGEIPVVGVYWGGALILLGIGLTTWNERKRA
jgi:drug/metabolite transporter (DMT)-like permease